MARERSELMKPYTTSQRLQQYSQMKNMSQADILRAAKPFCEKYGIKLGKSALSQYFSGKHVPDQAKLTILSLALNISEAWLMGYEVPMDRKTTPVSEIPEDGRLSRINELAQQLSPDEQDHIISQIEFLLSRR